MAARSEQASEYRRLYKLAVWHKQLRPQKLKEQPLCERCLGRGRIKPASVVNHRTPHKGDYALFTDYGNLESVCKPCHDSEIASEEALGYSKQVGVDGWPIDPRHPVNRGAAAEKSGGGG